VDLDEGRQSPANTGPVGDGSKVLGENFVCACNCVILIAVVVSFRSIHRVTVT